MLKEKLNCKKDNREEALGYEKHSAGVFKKDGILVGNIPIELSQLIDYVMKENKENFVSALVVGRRKREVRLKCSSEICSCYQRTESYNYSLGRNFKNKDKIYAFSNDFC